MFRNYLLIAVRNLFRHKFYSLINISGLGIGMACCVLILLYVQNEWSYDGYHERADRIYRVLRETRTGDGKFSVSPGTSGALGPALRSDFPEIQEAVRLWWRWDVWVRYGDRGFSQMVCLVDANVLEVFTLPLVEGDPETALKNPFSVVLTRKVARKYFGDEDPFGKVLTLGDRHLAGDFRVTGILKEIPKNSTYPFGFLISNASLQTAVWNRWEGVVFWRPIRTYVLLREGQGADALEEKLPAFMERVMGSEVRANNTYHLQPLRRMHLHSTSDYGMRGGEYGEISQVYSFSVLACFILLLSRDFVGLVLAANLLAWPVAYYAMNRWLQDFAYRIDLGVGAFVLGGILALVIAQATVSYQALKAATANPVDALRSE